MQTVERLHSEDSALCQRPAIFPADETCRTSLAKNGAADVFESHRPRLFGVAYRMLRIRADAEDVLQDAYLRWHEATDHDIQSPIGFLITVTTRLCLDRLRHLKKERDPYTGSWAPEAVDENHVSSPEEQWEIAEEVSAPRSGVRSCSARSSTTTIRKWHG